MEKITLTDNEVNDQIFRNTYFSQILKHIEQIQNNGEWEQYEIIYELLDYISPEDIQHYQKGKDFNQCIIDEKSYEKVYNKPYNP